MLTILSLCSLLKLRYSEILMLHRREAFSVVHQRIHVTLSYKKTLLLKKSNRFIFVECEASVVYFSCYNIQHFRFFCLNTFKSP